MRYMVWLFIQNAGFAAGRRPTDIVFRAVPVDRGFTGLGGIAFALAVSQFSPRRYDLLGRVVLDVRELYSQGCSPSPTAEGPGGPDGVPTTWALPSPYGQNSRRKVSYRRGPALW